MRRRSFIRRILAGAVVVAASPTALVAPKVWKRVKSWRDGYLTPEQAERFMQFVLDESIIRKDARVVRFRTLPEPDSGEAKPKESERPRLTNAQLVEKANISLGDLANLGPMPDDDPMS